MLRVLKLLLVSFIVVCFITLFAGSFNQVSAKEFETDVSKSTLFTKDFVRAKKKPPVPVEPTVYTVTYYYQGQWESTSDDVRRDFLTDFYAYINPTENITTFMHGDGMNSGFDGTWHSAYQSRLYTTNTKQIDSTLPYFINQPEYNEKWLPFYDLLDAMVTELNSTQTLWGDTYTGLIRFRQWFIGELFTTEQLSRMPSNLPLLKDYQTSYTSETLPVLLPTTYKDGATFLGWFDNPAFTGTSYTEIPVGSTENKSFYAKWSVVSNSAVFELNGGDWYNSKDSLSTDFLTDFYTYVQPSEDLMTFMHGVGQTSGFDGLWYTNTTYLAQLYVENTRQEDPNIPYFINQIEYNSKWLGFFDFIDMLTIETNSTQSLWGSTYVGNIRMHEWIIGTRYADDYRMPPNWTTQKYIASSPTITLVTPTKSTGTFMGWYDNDTFTGSPITEIPSGTTSNINLYAKWEHDTSANGYIEPSYDGNATLNPGNEVIIRITFYNFDYIDNLVYSSSDTNVATVDVDGVVHAVGPGSVIITITAVTSQKQTAVGFTVYSSEISDLLLQNLINLNTGILFTQDVYYIGYNGSFWNRIYNTANTYLAAPKDTIIMNMLSPSADNNPDIQMSSVEYIVVHDTGSATATSTALANSNWCVNPSNDGSSWHYTVGNDGVYQQMLDNYVAWHAGDGYVTFSKTNTGVQSTGERPTVTLSNGYYAFNGVVSNVSSPGSPINPSGILTLIENGNYVLGPTWYSSTYGAVCNKGGNSNGIGIETAVNDGSDVYWTWQKTAKLVADLMVTHNLDMTRVGFHQNFSGKVCPGTMINAGLTDEFLELVRAEYNIRKNYSNYTVTFISNNPDIIDNSGRVVNVPTTTTNVSYTVTVNNGTTSESIVLNTLVPGSNTWSN